MKLFFIFLFFAVFQDEVPYKPDDEFQANIDLAFKYKESKYAPSTFTHNGERLDKPSATQYPFLNVSVSNFKIQNDEVKVLALDANGRTLSKQKASTDLVLKLKMGFVDELKSGAISNQIIIYFLSAEKKKLRKITIRVTPEGVFEVNGKWHGQF